MAAGAAFPLRKDFVSDNEARRNAADDAIDQLALFEVEVHTAGVDATIRIWDVEKIGP
jgi:hypothetical protein